MKQSRSWFGVLVTVALFGLSACAPALSRHDPQQLALVDCLLPGQVRKLGTKFTYMTPRRHIRTSAMDCEIRGGESITHN